MALNPAVQWVIPTDIEIGSLPPNVRLVHCTLSSMRADFSRSLGFDVALTGPYKLTDFRPAFGHLFADEIGEAKWWGYCDLDVIFGQIMSILSPGLQSGARKLYVRGHFSVYLNDDVPNGWYRSQLVPGLDYRAIYQDPSFYGFDEWRGIYKILQALDEPIWGADEVLDICFDRFRPIANEPRGRPASYHWRASGQAIESWTTAEGRQAQRDGLYLHLQKRKMREPGAEIVQADEYYIHGDRFSLSPDLPWLRSAPGWAEFYMSYWKRRITGSARLKSI